MTCDGRALPAAAVESACSAQRAACLQADQHWAEDLLAVALHGGGDAAQQGGPHKVAGRVAGHLNAAPIQVAPRALRRQGGGRRRSRCRGRHHWCGAGMRSSVHKGAVAASRHASASRRDEWFAPGRPTHTHLPTHPPTPATSPSHLLDAAGDEPLDALLGLGRDDRAQVGPRLMPRIHLQAHGSRRWRCSELAAGCAHSHRKPAWAPQRLTKASSASKCRPAAGATQRARPCQRHRRPPP